MFSITELNISGYGFDEGVVAEVNTYWNSTVEHRIRMQLANEVSTVTGDSLMQFVLEMVGVVLVEASLCSEYIAISGIHTEINIGKISRGVCLSFHILTNICTKKQIKYHKTQLLLTKISQMFRHHGHILRQCIKQKFVCSTRTSVASRPQFLI
jgi:hypothetical protein